MKRFFGERTALVLDGAMGTRLIAKGLALGDPSILWNVDRPDAVWAVHRSYADAGSQSLTANTFGGSPLMLARHGIADRMVELNSAGVSLAKEAAGGKCLVMGDIGPAGDFLEPMGDLTETVLRDAVKAQAEVLVSGGVDALIVETMSDPEEMRVTIQALKEFGLPVLATFTYERIGDSFKTMMGTTPEQATKVALEAGAGAVGANCGTSLSLDDYLLLGEVLTRVAEGAPVILQPNAGSPIATPDGTRYETTAAAFGAWACKALNLGVRVLGGCCGTTEEHIQALAALVANGKAE
jgi:5-methyltetrahydrofolate--homocysteine methyltransferase